MFTPTEDAVVARIEDRVASINAWVELLRKNEVTPLDLAIALHTHGDFLRRDAALLLDLEVDEDEKVFDDQT